MQRGASHPDARSAAGWKARLKMNSVRLKTAIVKITMNNALSEIPQLTTIDKILIMNAVGRSAKIRGFKLDRSGEMRLRDDYRKLFLKLKHILEKA
jgi:hypothetical protein